MAFSITNIFRKFVNMLHVLLGIHLPNSFILMQYLPYFYWEFNHYVFMGYSVNVWAAVCVGVNILFPSASNSVSMLFFIAIPLILYFCFALLERRKAYLRDVAAVGQMKNEVEVERIGFTSICCYFHS